MHIETLLKKGKISINNNFQLNEIINKKYKNKIITNTYIIFTQSLFKLQPVSRTNRLLCTYL